MKGGEGMRLGARGWFGEGTVCKKSPFFFLVNLPFFGERVRGDPNREGLMI